MEPVQVNVNINTAPEKSYFDGGLLQFIGYSLLGIIVTVCTLGIYSFWMKISLQKRITKHTIFE